MSGTAILLADDVELRQAAQAPFFQRGGLRLLTAATGEEAFFRIEHDDPAVAVLPLEMPGLTGDECCRRIKADPVLRSTRIALVLGGDAPGGRERCRLAGCDEILPRPVQVATLLEAVCRLLGISPRMEERLSVELAAVCTVPAGKPQQAVVRDLSGGGLFLQCGRLFPTGTEMVVDLQLPGRAEPFRTRGQVVWVNHPEWRRTDRLPPGMGIRFHPLEAVTAEALERYLGVIGAAGSPGEERE